MRHDNDFDILGQISLPQVEACPYAERIAENKRKSLLHALADSLGGMGESKVKRPSDDTMTKLGSNNAHRETVAYIETYRETPMEG